MRAVRARDGRLAAGLAVLGVLLAAACAASIVVGTRDVTLGTIWSALLDFDPAVSAEGSAPLPHGFNPYFDLSAG